MKRFSYDIIGISEVRWTGKGETPLGDFIWSGEEKMGVKGVGFLLSPRARKSLIGFNPINSKIISARFEASPFHITVIHAYAPNRKWTWASPDGIRRNMIDLILIQKRWKTSVINCRIFQSAHISSDRVDVNRLKDEKRLKKVRRSL